RPGRFDRRIIIDRPDAKGRLEIIQVHLRQVPISGDVNIQELAQRTPGFTGADLANMVNEAAILAARENKTKVEMRHFHEAIERVLAGPQRKSRIITEQEKRVVAFHEAGHALLGWILPNANSVHKISVIPRGMAMGYTLHLPDEDRYLMSRSDLMDKMTVLIGGRVAEELMFQEVSTGAQNDLEEITELARKMVKEFGMSMQLGPLTYGKRYGPVFLGRDIATERDYSEQTALLIDQEVKRIVSYIYHRARTILSRYLDALRSIAEELYAKENIEKEQFERLVTSLGIPHKSAEFAFSLNDFLAFSSSASE
ncbi:MAG: cell division protein FtsH, partial [bacterium]